MKRRIINILLVLSLALMITSCGSDKTAGVSDGNSQQATMTTAMVRTTQANLDNAKYKEGEILVKFKASVATTASLKTHSAIGGNKVRTIPALNVDHVKLPQGMTVRDAIDKYNQDPNVEYAEPNYILRTHFIPNDTYFDPHQWALRNTGRFRNGTLDADIKASQAWDISTGSNNVIIAVVDTGIDPSHPDLFNNVISGWNFISNNNNPMDDVGHGTHVAGIIGAHGNNGMGISGVMWDTSLLPVKVCDLDDCPIDAIADGIVYAVDRGAKVINTSLGTYPPGSPSPTALYDAVNYANSHGVLVVASAGNEGNNNDILPVYPASYGLPNVISVAATDQNDVMVEFTNFGTSVHVAAPGANILSTMGPNLTPALCTASEFPGYDYCMGTSMSAPHVAGIAGLLYSYYTNFTYTQIRQTIYNYSDIVPNIVGRITFGRVNAYRSLSSLLTPTNLSASAASSSGINLSWTDNATGESGYMVERCQGAGCADFVQIATTGAGSTGFSDSGLSASTSYSYRVRAYNAIPAQSFYSGIASAATPAAAATSSSSGGGGGGCSVGPRQNGQTAMADVAVMLIPLIFIAVMRRKK